MKDYIFGMEAEEYNGSGNEDFVVNRGQGGGDNGNTNPYHKQYLSDPQNRARINHVGKITSIPSPYARMHLTDLAFWRQTVVSVFLMHSREELWLSILTI